MNARIIVSAIILAGILATTACKKVDGEVSKDPSFAVIDANYLKTGGDGSNWAMTGFSTDEQRFSPLDKINDKNVSKLGIAWFADLPDARGHESTPVVVGGKMFVTGPWSKIFAFDAKTGKSLWTYDPKVDQSRGVKACCDVVNRGVAFWKGRLFVGTIDGRLISLDATTGAEIWSQQTLDTAGNGTITGVPRIVKEKVVIGFGGAEFGVRGYVTAYDAATGKKAWRFYTTPNPDGKADGEASDSIMAKAGATWSKTKKPGDWHESGGGGSVWDAIVYDADLNQLYLGVGNGTPWNQAVRSDGAGDNLFLSAIVALNPDTGEYKWHYQETPGETWDFTATQPIILANAKGPDGTERKVLYHAPKNGFFFTVDRTNGKLIDAKPFVQGVNWASGYDLVSGRPMENPQARFYKTGKPFLAMPSALGAHNWQPMSYNPNTGLVYIPAQYVGAAYIAGSTDLAKAKPVGFNVGVDNNGFDFPDDPAFIKATIAATKGELVAFNPKTGKAAWTAPYDTPWNGGTMTTAGNLVFQGDAVGMFNAYAADTGKKLLSMPVQSGVLSGASTYMIDGEQYVAFITSKGGAFPLAAGYAAGASGRVPNIPRLIVLKLGGTGTLPDQPKTPPYVWNIPAQFGSSEHIAAGAAQYQRYCLVCHNPGAVGNGVIPDLRKSGTLADAAAFKSVVIAGILKQNGMASFAAVLKPADAENIRAYLITRAEFGKANDAILRPTK